MNTDDIEELQIQLVRDFGESPQDLKDYAMLRSSVGWPEISHADLKQALANSLAICVASEGDRRIGFGRLVGDGRLAVYLQDVMVHEAHQGIGIGRQVVSLLVSEAMEMLASNGYFGLNALIGTEPFYESFGVSSQQATDTQMGVYGA